MLELAYYHNEEVQKAYSKVVLDPDFDNCWAVGGYSDLELKLSDSTWDKVQFVSLYEGTVIGYFCASIDRACFTANSIVVANFTKSPNLVFSKDLNAFFDYLFVTVGLRSATWAAVEDSQGDRLYRKLSSFGVRVVGLEIESYLVPGPEYKNRVRYQLHGKDYLRLREERIQS